MRKWLDGLYDASAWLAGLCMILVLAMVSATILGRLLGFPVGGIDSYAGYAMAGAGFLALASTLKHGEHIRVTLVLGMLRGRARRRLELAALLIAVLLAGFLAVYSARLVWQSWLYHDISTGIDATPMWIPQILMAVGTLVFFIAFLDEFCLELRGRRRSEPAEDPHHE
jgi:TRAP-type C4-dicarboxylate transport system permease small subunit